MRIHDIYELHIPGSDSFVAAVQQHCAYDISPTEIRRLTTRCVSGEAFDHHWAHEDWWRDANQPGAGT